MGENENEANDQEKDITLWGCVSCIFCCPCLFVFDMIEEGVLC